MNITKIYKYHFNWKRMNFLYSSAYSRVCVEEDYSLGRSSSHLDEEPGDVAIAKYSKYERCSVEHFFGPTYRHPTHGIWKYSGTFHPDNTLILSICIPHVEQYQKVETDDPVYEYILYIDDFVNDEIKLLKFFFLFHQHPMIQQQLLENFDRFGGIDVKNKSIYANAGQISATIKEVLSSMLYRLTHYIFGQHPENRSDAYIQELHKHMISIGKNITNANTLVNFIWIKSLLNPKSCISFIDLSKLKLD